MAAQELAPGPTRPATTGPPLSTEYPVYPCVQFDAPDYCNLMTAWRQFRVRRARTVRMRWQAHRGE
jgi:hypothetical protein